MLIQWLLPSHSSTSALKNQGSLIFSYSPLQILKDHLSQVRAFVGPSGLVAIGGELAEHLLHGFSITCEANEVAESWVIENLVPQEANQDMQHNSILSLVDLMAVHGEKLKQVRT